MAITPLHTESAPAVIGTYSQAVATSANKTIYLVDLAAFQTVNEVMSRCFEQPYPARAAVQ